MDSPWVVDYPIHPELVKSAMSVRSADSSLGRSSTLVDSPTTPSPSPSYSEEGSEVDLLGKKGGEIAGDVIRKPSSLARSSLSRKNIKDGPTSADLPVRRVVFATEPLLSEHVHQPHPDHRPSRAPSTSQTLRRLASSAALTSTSQSVPRLSRHHSTSSALTSSIQRIGSAASLSHYPRRHTTTTRPLYVMTDHHHPPTALSGSAGALPGVAVGTSSRRRPSSVFTDFVNANAYGKIAESSTPSPPPPPMSASGLSESAKLTKGLGRPSTPKGVAELFLKTMAGEEKARSVEKEVEKADEKADEKALEAGLASSTSSTATLEDEKSKYRFCCWRRSTPPATTAVTPAEGNDEKPLPPTPRRRLCLRICLAILAFFVLTSAILIPLFIKVLIPRMISQGFSAGTGMSNTPFTLLGLQIKSIADAALPLNVTAMSNTSTDMTGANIDSFPTTGAGSLTVSMSNAGYAVPFNIPVTLSAPAVWTISLPRTFASIDGSTAAYPPLGFTPGSSRAYDETAKGWWPITVVRLSDDMSIRDGTLRINQRDVELRVPVPPGAIDGSGMQADVMAETVGAYKASGSGVFRADDDNAVGARMALFPLGVSFVKGVCGFFMTGDPASVPKVLIQARPDFKMGFLNFPAVPLSRVFDIGQLMKDAGLSPNTAPSSSSSDPSMNLTISGANTPTGDPRSFTTTVTMNLRNPCSLSLNLSSLSLRLNMSGIPVASITVPSLTLTQGARTISFDMQFAPPRGGGPQPGLVETLAGVLGSPSSSWVLGVDEVVVGSIGLASGASVARAWVQGLLDAVWVRVPFSILSGDVGAQAGVIIIKILESLTGGAL